MHSDINAAINHLRHGLEVLGVEAIPQRVHVESFIPTPSRIIPVKITPRNKAG